MLTTRLRPSTGRIELEFANGVRIRVDGVVERVPCVARLLPLSGVDAACRWRSDPLCGHLVPIAELFASQLAPPGVYLASANAAVVRRCGRRQPWFQALCHDLALLPVDG